MNRKLPEDAGNPDVRPFVPNREWLATALPQEQIDAMRVWFLDRYEDPANETPWDGEDKAYVFVWGGPYDPNDVIQEEFDDIVPYEVMEELIRELWGEVGDEWAPIYHEGVGYDDYLAHIKINHRDDPKIFLDVKLNEIFNLLDDVGAAEYKHYLLRQMAQTSIISALEAYLSDTVKFWTESNDKIRRKFLATNPDLQGQKIPLSELFDWNEKIGTHISDYISSFVWHRLDKVKPMFISTFGIEVPDISTLMTSIKVRHDIIHRAGRNSDGEVTDLDMDDLRDLADGVRSFTERIEAELVRVLPEPDGPAA